MAQRFSSPLRARTTTNPQVTAPKNIDQYLADLDNLLKRNTGSGTLIGQDTTSNVPMYVPGKVINPTGVGMSNNVSQTGNGITQPSPVQRNQPIAQPEDIQPMSASDFLSQLDQTFYDPGNQVPVDGLIPGQDLIDYNQGMASSPDGGVIGQDGVITYPDGSTRVGDPNAYGIQSLSNGNIRYSDGSIRQDNYAIGSAGLDATGRQNLLYNDQSVRTGAYQYQDGQPISTPSGLSGLETGIFGQVLPTTQPYGNKNVGMGYANNMHQGTDLRTRNLTGDQRNYKLPVNAQVVQVISADSNSPYGNSILLRLSTGEMLRFSHMAETPAVQEGQTLQAGQVFGTPGSTGNSDGEHLDLEYYNPQGHVDNPANFSGFSNPQGIRTPVPGQSAPGTIVKPAPQQTQQQGQVLGSTNQAPQQVKQPVQVPPTVRPNPTSNPAITTANVIDTANPTGTFDLGVTEALRGDPNAALQKQRNTIADVGTAIGAPELKTNELSQAQGTNPFRQAIGNLVDVGARNLGVRTDFGLSELLAGGKTTNTDQGLVPKVQASEINLSTPEVNPTAQSGQGLNQLASQGTGDLQNVFRSNMPKEKRAVGDISGTVDSSGTPQFSSLMDTAQSKAGMQKNDIRDSFFKMGGAEMYKQFMNPGVETNGALSMDLFNNDFYKDLGNITSVFGGSKDLAPATQKFVEFEKQKYPLMSRMTNNGQYDQSAIDEFNKSVDQYNNELNNYFNSIGTANANSQSIFTPRLAGSAKNVFSSSLPSSSAYSMPVSPRLNAPVAPSTPNRSLSSLAASAPSMSAPSSRVNMSAPSSAPSASMKVAPKPAPVSSAKLASQLKPLAAMVPKNAPPTPATNFNFSSGNSAPSATIKPQSKPTSNVFSKVQSYVNNIFRRK